MPRRKKDDEHALRELTKAYIDQAGAFIDQEIAESREKALRYYDGENPDSLPVKPGRSRIVDPVVRDTVEWVMPSLLRIFASGDKFISIEGHGPEDAAKARGVEAWVNYVLTRANPGYLLDYQTMRDALLEKTGWQKIWWDVEETAEESHFAGITAAELELIKAQNGVEVLEAQPIPAGDAPLYAVRVRVERREAKLRIAAVPPEEVLYTEDATLDRSSWWFLAHKRHIRIDELRGLGFDVADDISGPELESLDNTERLADTGGAEEEDDNLPATVDPGARKVWLYECYVRHDLDNDGFAEWLQVMRVGDELLSVERIDEVPLVCISPILRSHRLTGYSLADLIIDLQDLFTALHRNLNDHLYSTVNPRSELDVSGMTEHTVDDLLDNRVGGFVRVRKPGTVNPLQTSQLPAYAFSLIEHWQSKLEARTGVTRFNQGLSPDTLNKTATGTDLIMQAANQRIELIARNFAETGFRDRVDLIIKLSARHPEYLAQRTLLLNGQALQLTADDLNCSYDLVVNTAIGTGNRAQQLGHMQTLMNTYAALQQAGAGIGSQNPLFSTVNLYNAIAEMLRLAGYRNTADFVIDPQNPTAPRDPPAQPQPSVEQVLAQVEGQKAQVNAMEAQAKAQIETQRAQLEAAKAQQNAQLEVERLKLEQRKLGLAERELALKEYQSRVETNARLLEAQQRTDAAGTSAVIDFEQQLFERAMRERELALKEREAVLREAEGVAEILQRRREASEPDDDDEREMGVMEVLEALKEQLAAPKRVVRDANGMVVGVETVMAESAETGD
jgi:hypothetical protein